MKVANPASVTAARRRSRPWLRAAKDGVARGWQPRRPRRRCGRGWLVQLREPPVERGVATVAGRDRRLVAAFRLARRAAEMDVHVRRVAVPRPNQPQPGPVARRL